MRTEEAILQTLRSTTIPLKAKELATIVSRLTGQRVARRDVNKLLHNMKSSGKLIQDDRYCWRVAGQGGGRTQSNQQEQNRSRKPTLYDVLQVSPAAHPNVIEKAYKALVNLYHPDRAIPSQRKEFEDCLRSINGAYEVLSDPHRRKRYDESLSR